VLLGGVNGPLSGQESVKAACAIICCEQKVQRPNLEREVAQDGCSSSLLFVFDSPEKTLCNEKQGSSVKKKFLEFIIYYSLYSFIL
jgi:hypothetical protein